MDTPLGYMRIVSKDSINSLLLNTIEESAQLQKPFTLGLTGGSTPKAFYKWATEGHSFSEAAKKHVIWSTSDERMVPLDDGESNFGNADRMMLDPLGIVDANKVPWPVELDPATAAQAFEHNWKGRFGESKAFDICFLGMGDDGHTASLFPESPLLANPPEALFASVEVPGKGWRLTVTPQGLEACGKVVITVTGSNKAQMLRQVFLEEAGSYPVQILANIKDRVTWLVDTDAAAKLDK